jgi:hypothetical protein
MTTIIKQSKKDIEAVNTNKKIESMKQELLKSKLKCKDIIIQMIDKFNKIKVCSKCKVAKISDLFTTGRRECRSCMSKRHQAYYQKLIKAENKNYK